MRSRCIRRFLRHLNRDTGDSSDGDSNDGDSNDGDSNDGDE